jgi:hypothetical protein
MGTLRFLNSCFRNTPVAAREQGANPEPRQESPSKTEEMERRAKTALKLPDRKMKNLSESR